MSVAVLGAGIMGVQTAALLQASEPRAKVTLIADTFTPDTTSDVAAGYWMPYLTPDPRFDLLKRWGEETFRYTENLIWQQPEVGAGYQTGYEIYDTAQEKTAANYWTEVVHNYQELKQDQIFRVFGSTVPKAKYAEFFTTTYLASEKYIPWLMKGFQKNGGTIVKKHLVDLSELEGKYDVICNCTGLGSYYLFRDTTMYPIRGQVTKVYAPHIKHFVFYLPYYVLLNDEIVTLGGTMEKGNWSTKPDPKTTQDIWDTCTRLFPALRRGKILGHYAALRPARPSIRVEAEHVEVEGGGKRVPVIHNYGHGGSGLTMFYGCSKDAAEMTKDCLHRGYTLAKL